MLEAALGFPSFRHYCATILQHWRSDRTGWHQQDHGVEEAGVFRELRRCGNVPSAACRCRRKVGL